MVRAEDSPCFRKMKVVFDHQLIFQLLANAHSVNATCQFHDSVNTIQVTVISANFFNVSDISANSFKVSDNSAHTN